MNIQCLTHCFHSHTGFPLKVGQAVLDNVFKMLLLFKDIYMRFEAKTKLNITVK